MTAFALAALVLTLVSLAVLTRPLWRRGQGVDAVAQAARADEIAALRARLVALDGERSAGRIDEARHAGERTEVERRIVAAVVADAPAASDQARPPDRQAPLTIGLCLGVVAFAVAGYAVVGTPRALSPTAVVASAASGAAVGAEGITPQQVEQLVERLTARLKERPDDLEGWTILGRSQAVLGRPEQAAEAFKRALALKPDDADLMTHYADALAVANRGFEGEPSRYIVAALKADPDNLKALSLAGSAAFERQDYALAVTYWERLAKFAPSDEFRQQIQSGIDEARKLAASQGTTPSAAAPTPAPGSAPPIASASGTSVSGVVSLAPALAARVRPDDTVFVFARSAQGPRMPLAILKRKVGELPLSFTLDDSLAMSPQARLSSAASVIVGARISRSGDASPAPGDLQGASAEVSPGATDVRIEIRDVVGP